jgi:hypothetical protein
MVSTITEQHIEAIIARVIDAEEASDEVSMDRVEAEVSAWLFEGSKFKEAPSDLRKHALAIIAARGTPDEETQRNHAKAFVFRGFALSILFLSIKKRAAGRNTAEDLSNAAMRAAALLEANSAADAAWRLDSDVALMIGSFRTDCEREIAAMIAADGSEGGRKE